MLQFDLIKLSVIHFNIFDTIIVKPNKGVGFVFSIHSLKSGTCEGCEKNANSKIMASDLLHSKEIELCSSCVEKLQNHFSKVAN
jgi:hypothetical protein